MYVLLQSATRPYFTTIISSRYGWAHRCGWGIICARGGSVLDVQTDVVSLVTAFVDGVVQVQRGGARGPTVVVATQVRAGLRFRGRHGRRRSDGRPYRESSDALLFRSPRRRRLDRRFHRHHRRLRRLFLDLLQSNNNDNKYICEWFNNLILRIGR